MKLIINILIALTIMSCHNKKETTQVQKEQTTDKVKIEYAKAFEVESHKDYYILKVTQAWPEATKDYTYLLHKRGHNSPENIDYDVLLEIPIKSLVVTSTTHIPSLENLGVLNSLVGFADTDYVSSASARQLIDKGKIKDVGQNQSLNTELLINLKPEAIVSFAVKGENKTLSSLKKFGIPVLYNADWVEQHPLGKAEWIKFFGLLFDKYEKANHIFKEIKREYNNAKTLAQRVHTQPSVISGALWKDQWYLPAGESWQAQIIKDANAKYLYSDTKGSGSLSLAFESVLNQSQNADFWIAPAQYISYKQMLDSQPHYKKFKAFKNQNIYTFAKQKGQTGGVLYYELAPNRPDWVLKDLIKIFHPQLLPEYDTHFFKPLNP
ncbi:ABC transporter substrate-binding protein [Psychroflexus sp. MBR-150]|jgi:iron complex transport system substrate-binding protein